MVTAHCYITGMLFDKKSGWKVDLSIQYENSLKAINCMNLWLHVFPDAVITKHSLSSVRDGDEPSPAALSRIALISTTNACCYGTSKPRGPLAVMIRHLKILGYDCVLVRLARFFFIFHRCTIHWNVVISPVLQITDQELQSMSKQDKADFLRSRIFPESHRRDESLTK